MQLEHLEAQESALRDAVSLKSSELAVTARELEEVQALLNALEQNHKESERRRISSERCVDELRAKLVRAEEEESSLRSQASDPGL